MFDFCLLIISAALMNNLLLGQAIAAEALHASSLARFAPALALLVALAAPSAWWLANALQAGQLSHLFLLLWLVCAALLAGAVQWLFKRFSACSPSWTLLCANGVAMAALAPTQAHLSHALALGIGGGLGLWIALHLLDDLQQRSALSPWRTALQGTPMLLICSGLMSLALMGFSGMTGT